MTKIIAFKGFVLNFLSHENKNHYFLAAVKMPYEAEKDFFLFL